jgi:hypothetical protein
MIKLRHIAPVLALSLFAVCPAHASLIMEIANSQDFADQMNGSPTYTLGWSFTTNQSISVIALDAYDIFGDGFVELYDSGGDVLASATLTASGAQEGSPTLFYTQAIRPVVSSAPISSGACRHRISSSVRRSVTAAPSELSDTARPPPPIQSSSATCPRVISDRTSISRPSPYRPADANSSTIF